MFSRAASAAARPTSWLVVAGILVAALSLRGPIIAPTPVLADIQADLGIGQGTAGLLTTAPVLMFALLTPVAAIVIRRAGAEIALLLCLLGVLLGAGIRALPGFGWMLAGMVVIGASIAIGNVVIPVIIRRDVSPARVATVTAAYTATLNVGSLVTSLLTAPLADVVGWSWALLIWSALTAAGVIVWGVHLRRIRGAIRGERFSGVAPARGSDAALLAATGPVPVVAGATSALRMPTAWLLVATFSCQTVVYYGMTTWLPTIAADDLALSRTAAGALAGLFQGCGILGALLLPLLMRRRSRWLPVAVICLAWLALTFGVWLVPQAMLLWLFFGGVAHGGGFVIVFTMLVAISRSDAQAAGISALVQGVGYAIGAASPPVLGLVHEATGSWQASLALLAAGALCYSVSLVSATLRAGLR